MNRKGKLPTIIMVVICVFLSMGTTIIAAANFRADMLTVSGLDYKPQSGSISLKIESTSTEAVTVSLVLVLEEKQTGRIIEIDTDTKAVDSASPQTFSASVAAPDQSRQCRYYLWENSKRIPIENNPPAETLSASVSESAHTSIGFLWEPADDDKESVSSYNIYRLNNVENEYKCIGSAATTAYTDSNREYGEDLFYKIETVDSEGLKSVVQTELAAKTTAPASIVTNTSAESTNLVPVEKGIKIWRGNTKDTYGYQVAGYVGKRYCAMSTEHMRYGTTRIVGYGYYNVSDDSIPEKLPGNDTAWTEITPVLEITYFDEGTDTVTIEYNGKSGSNYGIFARNVAFNKTNTNVWKTKLIELPNAYFFEGEITPSIKNTADGFANFRIGQKNASTREIRPGFAISNISIRLKDDGVPMSAYISAENGIEARCTEFNPGMEIIKLQNGQENVKDTLGFELFNTVEYANEGDVLAEVEGRPCFKLPEYAVKMDDGGKLAAKSGVTLEITYFDGDTAGADILYCGGETALAFEHDNKWKKKEILLTGTAFNGSLTSTNGSSADFIVKSTDGSEIYISKIRAY